jgi:four helix bundle protein
VRDRTPAFDNGQDIRDRTYEFGRAVAKYCESLHGLGKNARVLSPQLLKCGTSVAAMLEEAKAAESRADFISKCAVALKEARESHVRLRTCVALGYGPAAAAATLEREANEIVAILTCIVRTARINLQKANADS